jgi:hypothetical protein
VTGTATIAERPEDSTLEVEIDASSIDTQDETRDAHLRSNDFFGVEQRPTTTFRSTAVRPGDGDRTIRGVTRPVTVDVEFLGAAVDPWGNQRIGFSGVVPEVDREDWGLTWNTPLETGGFLLSRSVRLNRSRAETGAHSAGWRYHDLPRVVGIRGWPARRAGPPWAWTPPSSRTRRSGPSGQGSARRVCDRQQRRHRRRRRLLGLGQRQRRWQRFL